MKLTVRKSTLREIAPTWSGPSNNSRYTGKTVVWVLEMDGEYVDSFPTKKQAEALRDWAIENNWDGKGDLETKYLNSTSIKERG